MAFAFAGTTDARAGYFRCKELNCVKVRHDVEFFLNFQAIYDRLDPGGRSLL